MSKHKKEVPMDHAAEMINKVGINTCPMYFATQDTEGLGKNSHSGSMWGAARSSELKSNVSCLAQDLHPLSAQEMLSNEDIKYNSQIQSKEHRNDIYQGST